MQSKTIEQLENHSWGEPPADERTLVKKSFYLRKKPIDTLDIEELRFLIGQDVGVRFILPIAVDKLEHDILAEGDYYPGDLLSSVLSVDDSYWQSDLKLKQRIMRIINNGISTINNAELTSEIKKDLLEKIKDFQQSA